MTHIFIVDENTFKIHLQYMFAGTGRKTLIPNFIGRAKTVTTADSEEKTFVSMISDISKVRQDDLIAFYVTGCQKIFGFFKAVSDPFFNDNPPNYLGANLGRYLPFRILIEPYEVFADGITEHEALDCIKNVNHPYEMCWSLIYRKLTGLRGCSFITDFEYDRLYQQIYTKNNGISLANNNNFDYDDQNKLIKATTNVNAYTGTTAIPLDISARLQQITGAYETHLQAYVSQYYDKAPLRAFLFPQTNVDSIWFGNEVVCSVGEQRIDCLLITETTSTFYIRVIELKDEPPKAPLINEQLDWYLQWVMQYITPLMNNKQVKIIPTIIAPENKRSCANKTNFMNAATHFNNTKPSVTNNISIAKLEFISFDKTSGISFKKVF